MRGHGALAQADSRSLERQGHREGHLVPPGLRFHSPPRQVLFSFVPPPLHAFSVSFFPQPPPGH